MSKSKHLSKKDKKIRRNRGEQTDDKKKRQKWLEELEEVKREVK